MLHFFAVHLAAPTVTLGSTVSEVCAARGVELSPQWELLGDFSLSTLAENEEGIWGKDLVTPCGRVVREAIAELKRGTDDCDCQQSIGL